MCAQAGCEFGRQESPVSLVTLFVRSQVPGLLVDLSYFEAPQSHRPTVCNSVASLGDKLVVRLSQHHGDILSYCKIMKLHVGRSSIGMQGTEQSLLGSSPHILRYCCLDGLEVRCRFLCCVCDYVVSPGTSVCTASQLKRGLFVVSACAL